MNKTFWDSREGIIRDNYKRELDKKFLVEDNRFNVLTKIGYEVKKKFGQIFIIKDGHTLAILQTNLGIYVPVSIKCGNLFNELNRLNILS